MIGDRFIPDGNTLAVCPNIYFGVFGVFETPFSYFVSRFSDFIHRDDSTDQRIPIRLLELVRKYPYTQVLSSPTTDLLLPRPRFTTSLYNALFVRIEFEYPTESHKPKVKIQPLTLLADAFSANVDSEEYAELWAKITAGSRNGSNPSPLSNTFADETIRFLACLRWWKRQGERG